MNAPGVAQSAEAAGRGTLDLEEIRGRFPALSRAIHGRPLVYLDSAASCLKPRDVVEAEAEFALRAYANVHRGVHTLSQEATAAYDAARGDVARFIGAGDPSEVVFTSGTTGALNLVAQSYGRQVLRQGDEILLTELEHHSNIVPWQLVAEACGASIRAIPVTDQGELDLEAARRLLSPRTRIVAVTHASNVLGTVNPVAELAEMVHAHGAVLVVDGAQAVAHLPVKVGLLGCDFYAASAHKMYGPTGVGFLWGRKALLEQMPPWQGGGGMVQQVTFERTTFAPPPARFEAGTPPITQAIGLAAAVRFLGSIPRGPLAAHEADLLAYASEGVAALPGARLIGTARDRVSVLSLTLEGIHPHDVGTLLDLRGVAVRASHHCAQPLMRRFGVTGTVRVSFGVYNTREEIDRLIEGLEEAWKVFRG